MLMVNIDCSENKEREVREREVCGAQRIFSGSREDSADSAAGLRREVDVVTPDDPWISREVRPRRAPWKKSMCARVISKMLQDVSRPLGASTVDTI